MWACSHRARWNTNPSEPCTCLQLQDMRPNTPCRPEGLKDGPLKVNSHLLCWHSGLHNYLIHSRRYTLMSNETTATGFIEVDSLVGRGSEYLDTKSLTDSLQEYLVENGRRYHVYYGPDKNLMPTDEVHILQYLNTINPFPLKSAANNINPGFIRLSKNGLIPRRIVCIAPNLVV